MKAIRVLPAEIVSVGSAVGDSDRAEMAIPSYTHWNPLIRWLFWQRLDAASELAGLRKGMRILDFGVGSGILLRTLVASGASRIVGVDLVLGPATQMAKRLEVSLELVEASDFQRWTQGQPGRFDRIFALDVLEHVSEAELSQLSADFASLLTDDGALIVSGPTESVAYKLGRALAGFKGDYHHRNIFDINSELARTWSLDLQTRVPLWPLPRAFLLSRFVKRHG
jgi:2-polyprenyl-3-methyl-5-hydroxy-6-metoxy-1,4-benzoquinol methylase